MFTCDGINYVGALAVDGGQGAELSVGRGGLNAATFVDLRAVSAVQRSVARVFSNVWDFGCGGLLARGSSYQFVTQTFVSSVAKD